MRSTMNLVITQTDDDGFEFDTDHEVDMGKLIYDYDYDLVTYIQDEFVPMLEWHIS